MTANGLAQNRKTTGTRLSGRTSKQTGQAGLKDKPEKLIKNKPSVIAGTLMGLITALYLTELFQYLLAAIFGLPNAGLSFRIVYLLAQFESNSDVSLLINIFITVTPLVVLFTSTQIVGYKITKTSLGAARYSLMLYQLIMVGYVLFYLLYQAVSIVINIDPSSDFVKLAALLKLEYPYNIFGIFFIIFILAIFININARKISKYINK